MWLNELEVNNQVQQPTSLASSTICTYNYSTFTNYTTEVQFQCFSLAIVVVRREM